MARSQKWRFAFLLTFALAPLLFLPVANAQSQSMSASSSKPDSPDPSDEGWHFAFSPYLWLAGVNGTVGILGHDGSIHQSPTQVLSNFNFGLMGAFETRYNRVVMPVDFMWVKLGNDKTLPFEQGPTSINADLKETILTPKIGYRFIDNERFKVDALFGIRYWHFATNLSLTPSEFGSFGAAVDWVDGLGGAKIEAALTPKVVLTVFGDAGGGTARSDYQVGGLLGYRLGKKWILQIGYRYMDVNYRANNSKAFVYDAAQSGFVLGATWNIK
jgi:hypothetical protein